uniref:Uncharacterized protein n=1 Tax=Lophocladia kuetzingii TaxID=675577 RepID=A0A1Z1MP17_9FLOR|nr:hypothetical protein [Lophocladia kuetzingii]ARW67686.1 hypothetical protein [Lophocladia kuetzingii]
MIKGIQEKIRKGEKKYFKQRRNLKDHPKKIKYDQIRNMIETRQKAEEVLINK